MRKVFYALTVCLGILSLPQGAQATCSGGALGFPFNCQTASGAAPSDIVGVGQASSSTQMGETIEQILQVIGSYTLTGLNTSTALTNLGLGNAVIEVASIAALRANTVPTPQINVAAYYSGGSTGGGPFTLVAANTSACSGEAADNGGTIICDASNDEYQRQNTINLTPEEFGAKGDNSTDDHAAINAWAQFGCGNPNVTLVPDSQYYMGTTALNLTSNIAATGCNNGIKIDGTGWAAVFRWSGNGSSGVGIDTTGLANGKLKNFTVQCGSSAATAPQTCILRANATASGGAAIQSNENSFSIQIQDYSTYGIYNAGNGDDDWDNSSIVSLAAVSGGSDFVFVASANTPEVSSPYQTIHAVTDMSGFTWRGGNALISSEQPQIIRIHDTVNGQVGTLLFGGDVQPGIDSSGGTVYVAAEDAAGGSGDTTTQISNFVFDNMHLEVSPSGGASAVLIDFPESSVNGLRLSGYTDASASNAPTYSQSGFVSVGAGKLSNYVNDWNPAGIYTFSGSMLGWPRNGSWTPAIICASGGPPTYNYNVGSFEQTWPQITARFSLSINSAASCLGALTLSGLPIGTSSGPNDYPSVTVNYMNGVTLTSGYTFVGGIGNLGSGSVSLQEMGSGESPAGIPLSNGSVIDGIISYRSN